MEIKSARARVYLCACAPFVLRSKDKNRIESHHISNDFTCLRVWCAYFFLRCASGIYLGCAYAMAQRIACGNMIIMDFYDSFHFHSNVCCAGTGITRNVNQLSLKRTDSLRKWDFWCSNSFNHLFVSRSLSWLFRFISIVHSVVSLASFWFWCTQYI